MTTVIDVDVLVVGGGSAALRAAVEAHRAGARVALAVKGQLGVIGLRGAGATASGTAADRRGFWPVHESCGVLEGGYEDILQLGLGMADPSLVGLSVEGTAASRRALERLGVPVRLRPGGAIGGAPPIGNESRGTVVFGIAPTLAAALRRTDCQILEHTMITDLLTRDGVCVGAVGIDEETGEVMALRAGAVILATGGAVQLFKHNIHPDCVTGDGYAMGYRAGAELMNMEFMQIFLGIPHPSVNNLTNWVWKQEARVYNSEGEEFLERYLPAGSSLDEAKVQAATHNPYSTRDSLSRYLNVALMKEVLAGRGTTHDGIYMDLTAPGVQPPPERQTWLRYRGIHWDRAPIEIVVYAMCSNGGLRVDRDAQTTVPRLYAVGECSSGMYGADRHGGHMISTSQVFGAIAGRHAARAATGSKPCPLPREALAAEEGRIAGLRAVCGRWKPQEVRRDLQQQAWNHLLAVRTEAGITSFLETVEALGEEKLPALQVQGTGDLVAALELRNLLEVGEILGRVCLLRRESRGGHYREDYPLQDDARWLKSIVVKRVDGRMDLSTVALHPDWKSRPGDMFGQYWG